ncbi:MAG: hypothetical protein HQL95_02260 [Magnetococcales bacterium]|nr:hypothetical protein [Magnetococcales bacterium]
MSVEHELGKISGQLEAIQEAQRLHTDKLTRLDDRVGKLDAAVKVHSVVGGGATALAVATFVDLIKSRFASM